MTTALLDGNTLTLETLCQLANEEGSKIDLSPAAWEAVREGRQVVENVLSRGDVVYGINTGFGNFANVVIDSDKLKRLQENLIRSHAAGVGELLPLACTRRLMLLRINVLAKGHSGIRPENLKKYIDAFNKNLIPAVPAKGTVGASGDLAPLSHLALGMLGEGDMWDPERKSYRSAASTLKAHGLTPIDLGAKEGLALINGTQLIASIGAEACVRAENIARQADVVAALTLETLLASSTPFTPAIHYTRAHLGQNLVAGRLRNLLNFENEPSEIAQSHLNCHKVQDSYTLRCIPQIHGIVHDTIKFSRDVIATEANSATDNPMIFPREISMKYSIGSERKADKPSAEPDRNFDMEHVDPATVDISKGVIISGGNFHGEYPAKAMDFLAIGIHEIASVSERRIERLVNPALSSLPAFLVKEGGLNSGFMIAHCTAASLVSENKTLAHPASVDSLSTSAAQEDHVSMGGFAARKALSIVSHVEMVIAIELLCACQALDFLRPLKTTPALEAVYKLVRAKVPTWDHDRYMAPDIEAVTKILRSNEVWEAVKDFVDPAYFSVESAKREKINFPSVENRPRHVHPASKL